MLQYFRQCFPSPYCATCPGFSVRFHRNPHEYINMAKLSFKAVKIITIQPYYPLAKERCPQVKPETGDMRRFYVQIIAEGEGNMSGSALNGALQTLFLSLIREDGEWKTDTFATIETCP